MKCLIAFSLITLLMLPLTADAQDLTETYEDDQMSFDYPAGWYVQFDPDNNNVSFSNVAVSEENDLFEDLVPGVITGGVGVWTEGLLTEDLVMETQDARFALGFVAGAWEMVISIVSGFSGEQDVTAHVGALNELELNGETGYTVTVTSSAHGGITLLIVSYENGALLTASCLTADFKQWEDTIWAMANTVAIK